MKQFFTALVGASLCAFAFNANAAVQYNEPIIALKSGPKFEIPPITIPPVEFPEPLFAKKGGIDDRAQYDCVCNGGGNHTSFGGRAGGVIGGGVGAAIGGRRGGNFGAGAGGTAGATIGNEIGHHAGDAGRGVMRDRVKNGGKHYAPSDKL